MNSTNTTNDTALNYSALAWIICLGLVIVVLIIIVCYMCFETSKRDTQYINWVKAKKQGEIQEL